MTEKPVEVQITTDKDESEDAVNDIITEDMDMGGDEKGEATSFLAAVREIGEISFKKYPAKTSNLTDENAAGIVAAEVINSWMEKRYKFTFDSLKTIIKSKRENVISVKGYGNTNFNANLNAIHASFEQTEIPQNLANKLMRR